MKRATTRNCCSCCFSYCCGFQKMHSVNHSSNEIDDLNWNHPRWVGREPSDRRGYSCHNCEIFNLHRAKQQQEYQQQQQQLPLLRKFPTSPFPALQRPTLFHIPPTLETCWEEYSRGNERRESNGERNAPPPLPPLPPLLPPPLHTPPPFRWCILQHAQVA